MMGFKYKSRVFLVFCGIIFNNTSFAEMYKWIDEEGKTHYSQSPPNSGVEVHTIKAPSKVDTDNAGKTVSNQKKKADDLRDKRLAVEAEKKKSKEDAALKDENCKRAKTSYASYQRPRITEKNPDGSVRVIKEEERQKNMANAKKQVSELCK
jgi:hypothetical protein